VRDGSGVAVEANASTALCGTGELGPRWGVATSTEVGEGHVGEGHGSWGELITAGDAVSFQSGVSISELATAVGAVKSGAGGAIARLDGVIGFRVAAVGGHVTSEGIAWSEALDGGGVVGGSRGTAVPRGKRPARHEVVEGEDGLENGQFGVLAFKTNEPEEGLSGGIGRSLGNAIVGIE